MAGNTYRERRAARQAPLAGDGNTGGDFRPEAGPAYYAWRRTLEEDRTSVYYRPGKWSIHSKLPAYTEDHDRDFYPTVPYRGSADGGDGDSGGDGGGDGPAPEANPNGAPE